MLLSVKIYQAKLLSAGGEGSERESSDRSSLVWNGSHGTKEEYDYNDQSGDNQYLHGGVSQIHNNIVSTRSANQSTLVS